MSSSSTEPTVSKSRGPICQSVIRCLLVFVAAGAIVGGNWAFWHQHTKRFQVVRKGMFYRSAQPSELGLYCLVKYVGIKTVLSVQLYDFRLHHGVVSFGDPDGGRESEYVTKLGARPVQWPMGVEKSWPWVTPWQFEQFFQLLDDPENWPVAVHCQGGRHRTGTLAALFRLEYDRWDPDRALAEMYQFKFGGAIRLQEHNLRTYLPRPHPDEIEWTALKQYWTPLIRDAVPSDYEALVRYLHAARRDQPEIERALERYLEAQRPFALPLVQRLIEQADDLLIDRATRVARECLESSDAGRAAWSMSAAIIADFGTPDQQQQLLTVLGDSDFQRLSAECFDAIVDGVTNRYTPNRIAYLRPLLENESLHLRPGTTQCRYCDTAVARLCAIVDENFPDVIPGWGIDAWNNGRIAARAWIASHPAECQLSRLKPATGQTVVQLGDPPPREDLSRARY